MGFFMWYFFSRDVKGVEMSSTFIPTFRNGFSFQVIRYGGGIWMGWLHRTRGGGVGCLKLMAQNATLRIAAEDDESLGVLCECSRTIIKSYQFDDCENN